MNDSAKISLSPFEMELVTNAEWIFVKQLIIKKVYHLFGRLNDDFKSIFSEKAAALVPELRNRNGKISKGENYKGLPYVILDYPTVFGKENICAVRTLFWWGNFFSISLHLSGKYFTEMKKSPDVFSFLQQNNFYVCVNENEWEHDFNESNFIKIDQLGKAERGKIYLKSFFKIAKKIELEEWDKAEIFLVENFKKLIDFIILSFPGDGKAL